MTSGLSQFASRLRDFIRESSSIGSNPYPASNENDFNALALELFGLQFAHNTGYRRFCEGRGVQPQDVENWRQIPAMPAVAFKELELSCLPPEERTHVFHSSGTTEHRPSRHFHSAESLAVYEASLRAWFTQRLASNLQFAICNLQFAILTPSPAQAPHSSLVHMFETLRCDFSMPPSAFLGTATPDGGWSLDTDATSEALQGAIVDKRPVLLLGTAFSFVHLLDSLGDQKSRLQLPAGSCALETGGYKGRSRSLPRAELHSLITDRLGIAADPIICEYGMSELSSQAYAFALRPFAFPPWARIEVISPETGREVNEGETGLLRVFDLANVFSVMAVQTEDLAIRRGEGFELIGRATLAEARGCSLMATS